MAINLNIQKITRARARRISNYFSTVDMTPDAYLGEYCASNEVSLFLEGPGHEDTAARIAALINEQIIRRDTAKDEPDPEDLDEADREMDERQLEEQAQEDRRQAHNDELGPHVADYPYEEEQAMIERDRERDDEVPF